MTLNQLLAGDGFCFDCTGDLGWEEGPLRVADPDLAGAGLTVLPKDTVPSHGGPSTGQQRSSGKQGISIRPLFN